MLSHSLPTRALSLWVFGESRTTTETCFGGTTPRFKKLWSINPLESLRFGFTLNRIERPSGTAGTPSLLALRELDGEVSYDR